MPRNHHNTVAVIMAGGMGTRFWPLSTGDTPKQFLTLFDDKTLLNLSYDRITGLIPPERVLVLTNERYTSLVRSCIPGIPPENIIGEPCRRDTAAAITLAAEIVRRRYGNPVMTVLTADHLIEPVDQFRKALAAAIQYARTDCVLYTFGIRPTFPATAYGYIELGETVYESDGIVHYNLLSFKEKPDADTAARYVDSGRFLWNSGMFVWTAETIISELKRFLPNHVENIGTALTPDGRFISSQALTEAFEPLPAVSIDYAVMEKSSRVRCICAPFTWSDVGGWLAVEHILDRDSSGNSHRGVLFALDSSNNIVFCENQSDRVVLIGVNDCIAVKVGPNLLVTSKARADDIKRIVESEFSKTNGDRQ
jgi:mannose-1-phosphate guanylyltransferase